MSKILAVTLLLFLGCTSGPKLDSKLDYLNGANYKKRAVILGVPVNETKDSNNKKKAYKP